MATGQASPISDISDGEWGTDRTDTLPIGVQRSLGMASQSVPGRPASASSARHGNVKHNGQANLLASLQNAPARPASVSGLPLTNTNNPKPLGSNLAAHYQRYGGGDLELHHGRPYSGGPNELEHDHQDEDPTIQLRAHDGGQDDYGQEYDDQDGVYEYEEEQQQDGYEYDEDYQDEPLDQEMDDHNQTFVDQETPLRGKGPHPHHGESYSQHGAHPPAHGHGHGPPGLASNIHARSLPHSVLQATDTKRAIPSIPAGLRHDGVSTGQRVGSPVQEIGRSSYVLEILGKNKTSEVRQYSEPVRVSSPGPADNAVSRSGPSSTQVASAPVTNNKRKFDITNPSEKQATPDGNPTQPEVAQVPEEEKSLTDELDYSLEDLKRMPYSDLENQSFDENPRANRSQELQQGPLSTRLENVKDLPRDKQRKFFDTLKLEDWEEAGDWFLGQFQDVLGKMRQSRKDRRELARGFEQQVKAREDLVEARQRGIVRVLEDMKKSGHVILKAEPV
jgi:hypothetical protein